MNKIRIRIIFFIFCSGPQRIGYRAKEDEVPFEERMNITIGKPKSFLQYSFHLKALY